ncbi:MAG: hypothetical protein CSA45_05000 [Gammaproteobacteria bacterium]|nr:MAG: hypothetical protein CSA45_05000 [Gammaproteobacteria bacterium]
MKKLFTVIGLFVVIASASAESKMSQFIDKSKLSIACQEKLVSIADGIIGIKRHRILEHNVPETKTFHAFVLLSYNDQDSHLSFTAIPTVDKNNHENCQINVNESYQLPADCLDAREFIFKRWKLLGKLNEETFVLRYDHPRNKKELPQNEKARAMAYLTMTSNGRACLITKQQQNVPALPREE